MYPIVKARLLQSPSIIYNGSPLQIRLRKAEGLLYYMLVQKHATRTEITGLLWADENDMLAYRHLRDQLYHLKKNLPVQLILPDGKSALRLNPEVIFDIDIDLFQSTSDVSLYHAEFLSGFSIPNNREYNDWLARMRTNLRDTYLLRLNQLAAGSLEADKPALAEKYWLQYFEEEPTAEPVASNLMRLYRTQTNYSRATLIYHKLYKSMEDWLGISPLKETTTLYYSIMDEWNTRADGTFIPDETSLIGRREILYSLLAQFEHTGAPSKCPTSFILCGEAGVGKTFLLNYFLPHLNDRYCIIKATCFKSKQEEFLFPWQTAMLSLFAYITDQSVLIPQSYLRAASILFPIFCVAGTTQTVETQATFQITPHSFESILSILAFASKSKPILFVFEDIQWMDTVSLKLLDAILHKLSPEQVAFAGTCRSLTNEEISNFIQITKADDLLCCYELSPFTYEESMQLINQFDIKEYPQKIKEQLFHFSRGNAFLLVQLLGSLLEKGHPDSLPQSLNDILSYRLAGLNEEGRQVLDLIAMFSGYAPYTILEQLSSQPKLNLLYICQELCSRSIITQIHDGQDLSLTFAQEELRTVAYSQVDPIKRRILHLKIANIMEQIAEATHSVPDSEIIYQFQEGGDKLKAFEYKINRIKNYAYLNCVTLTGSLRDANEKNDFVQQPVHILLEAEKEFQDLKKIYPKAEILDHLEISLLYTKGCLCIYQGNYDLGVPAMLALLAKPNLGQTTYAQAHEQMAFYGIQTYQTNIMRSHIARILQITYRTDTVRYAIARRYYGYLLVMENSYEKGRKELYKSIEFLQNEIQDSMQADMQIAYAYNYIGEAYRKEGLYLDALSAYQKAIALTESYPAANSLPAYYGNCAAAAFAMAEYGLMETCLNQAKAVIQRLQAPAWYSQSLICAYTALLAFATHDDPNCYVQLLTADKLANTLSSPYEKGIISLVKAILRTHCDEEHEYMRAEKIGLTETPKTYLDISKRHLQEKAGIFENQLLMELDSGNLSSLADFWNK